ncbi:MAG TPA: hypothetical protein VEH77_06805 [Roseiarcus sp.]|nr:hypothetical protein [Roseiarcus sp.]
MTKALIILGMAWALALPVGEAPADPGASAPVVPENGVDVARGDEWVYQTEDSLTGDVLSNSNAVVVDHQADRIDVRIRTTDPVTGLARVGAATFDSFWRRLPDDSGEGSGTGDSWGLRPNLQAGDDWNYNFERQLGGGPIKMGWIGYAEALGIERIDLPNGRTVDAQRIEFFERPSIARYRLEMHVVEWFAPNINRYVRREVEVRHEGKVTESTAEILQDYIRRR